MPPFRFSFFGRFLLVFCAFFAAAFCLYCVEAVLFSAPAPLTPAYDIAPQLAAREQAETAQTRQAAVAQAEADAAARALKAEKQTALAQAGGIDEKDAIKPFFAAADLERGRRVFARCAACHTAGKNGKNRIGPNLWSIQGRAVAAEAGFHYSAALKAYGQQQKRWDLASLNHFLYAPAAAVPRTIMSYPGVKDLQERADLLLYLTSLADSAPQTP